MNISLSLLRLQNLFTRRAVIRRRLEQIEAALAADEKLREAKDQLAIAESAYNQVQKEQAELQTSINEKKLKKELTHAQLFGGKVRSPKELQDLQNEENALEAYLAKLDESMLGLMASAEERRAELAEAREKHQAVLESQASENSLLSGEKSKLNDEMPSVNTQLKQLSAEIPPAVFAEFQDLLKAKKGRAVVEIKDGGCSGCGMDLTAAEIQMAKSAPTPIKCKNCGRMLYFKS